jgi:hypothetical protein
MGFVEPPPPQLLLVEADGSLDAHELASPN